MCDQMKGNTLLKDFFAQPAPRKASYGVYVQFLLQSGRHAFFMPWLFVILSLALLVPPVLFFAPWSYFTEKNLKRSTAKSIPMRITRLEPTAIAFGRRQVYRVFATGLDEERVEFINYYIGTRHIPGFSKKLYDIQGRAIRSIIVPAKYDGEGKPEVVLLPAGRLTIIPVWMVVTLLLCIVLALFIIFVCCRWESKMSGILLRYGELFQATVTDWQRTRFTFGGKRRYKVTFAYNDAETGPESITMGVYGIEAEYYQLRLLDMQTVPLVVVPGGWRLAQPLPLLMHT